MSKLTFQKDPGVLILTSRDHKIIGVWRAHNTVAHGHQNWPLGTFSFQRYNPHPENAAPSTSQDCWSGKGLPKDKAGLGCFGIYLTTKH